MKMSHLKNITIISILSSTYSCITPISRNQHELDLPQQAINTQNEDTSKLSPSLVEITQKDKEDLFIALSSNLPLQISEYDLLNRIANFEEKNKFDNAILVIGAFKHYLERHTDSYKFNTTNIEAPLPNNEKINEPLSLEQSAAIYNVNLIHNIETNILLESKSFILYAKKILSLKRKEDQKYTNILYVKIRSWEKLFNEKDQKQEEGEKQVANNEKPIPFESSEFNRRNILDLLSESEIYVNEEKYSDAIKILKSIDEDSIYYETAQIKIKDISNVAITKMRQLAATAFNKAIPLSDKNARKHYLTKAQTILEEARSLFPDSDKIETINKNLEIIESNLKIISTSTP